MFTSSHELHKASVSRLHLESGRYVFVIETWNHPCIKTSRDVQTVGRNVFVHRDFYLGWVPSDLGSVERVIRKERRSRWLVFP